MTFPPRHRGRSREWGSIILRSTIIAAVVAVTIFAVARLGAGELARAEAGPGDVASYGLVDNTVAAQDVIGRPLDAHDGDMIDVDGQAYLYGTAYGCGFVLGDPTSPYCGVRVYRSLDLANWTPAGAVADSLAFDPNTADWQAACAAHVGCYRPHVIRRDDGRFVMWVNTHGGGGTESGYRVLLADSPEGPFVDVGARPRLAVDPGDGGLEHGDLDLAIDPDTGIGYIVYTVILAADNAHFLVVEQLDATLTTGVGAHVHVAAAGRLVEAPALWKSPTGTWHLAFSDPAAPYGVVPTGVVTAGDSLGTWSAKRTMLADSCSGQPSMVARIHGRDVYVSDRWVQGAANQTSATLYFGLLRYDALSGDAVHSCTAEWQLPPTEPGVAPG